MKPNPSIDAWLEEAKRDPRADQVGMYLTHNGIVRSTPKAQVRAEDEAARAAGEALGRVVTVDFSYDAAGVDEAVAEALSWPGIYYVKVWLNEGEVPVGGSLMYVLIGADIRPNAIDALQRLVGRIKNDLVVEREIYA